MLGVHSVSGKHIQPWIFADGFGVPKDLQIYRWQVYKMVQYLLMTHTHPPCALNDLSYL